MWVSLLCVRYMHCSDAYLQGIYGRVRLTAVYMTAAEQLFTLEGMPHREQMAVASKQRSPVSTSSKLLLRWLQKDHLSFCSQAAALGLAHSTIVNIVRCIVDPGCPR